jgi:hypothetical protein
VTIVAPHLLLANLRPKQLTPTVSGSGLATKLMTDDIEPEAPFPHLSCLEATIADKIGRAGLS